MKVRAAICAALVAAVAVTAQDELPTNDMRAVADGSRFAEEPAYYVTPHMVDASEMGAPPAAEQQATDDEPAPGAARMYSAPTAEEMRLAEVHPLRVSHADVVPGAGGYRLKPGQLFNPGYYHPPPLPFRFPSYPYDNPSFTPFPSMWPVQLPKAWRSDALNIHSDGARYMQNMEHFDHYPAQAQYS